MAQSAFKQGLIWLHKWLGAVLALFFAMWFASGIILYFVPFPELTEAERLAGISWVEAGADCCLGADEAADRAGLSISAARLGMFEDHPVWRVLGMPSGMPATTAPRWHMLDARTGASMAALSPSQAAALARAFSGRQVETVEMLDRDQWTVPQGLDPYRPLYKASLGAGSDGDDGLVLYISATAAEVVRDTRRFERFWNWLGAVPHWIYPTVLRQFPSMWHHVVVWLSVPGVVVAATGLALGGWQLFLNRARWIPYRKFWMRWHHILGLASALFTLTWMLSGLLSMNPFGIFGQRGPSVAELKNWRGTDMLPGASRLSVAQALRLASREGVRTKEVSVVRVAGSAWYVMRAMDRQWLIPADRAMSSVLRARLPDALIALAFEAVRDTRPERIRIQDAYDAQYYARQPDSPDSRWRRPLPVWRAEWADGVRLYADPASGRLLFRADDSGRWQRIFYHGLHSLDFAPLVRRPALRTLLVVGLSALGFLMSVTACVLAFRVLSRPRRTGGRQGMARRDSG